MLSLRELVFGVAAGGVLILFAVLPTYFEALAEGVRNAVVSIFPASRPRVLEFEPIEAPRLCLAGVGIALVAISVLGYSWT